MDDNDPGVAQEAWRELLDALRAGDRSFIDAGRGHFDDREIGYGYRNLVHILGFATGMYLNADLEWPMFAAALKDPPGEKTLGEHPDVHYQWAAVRGGRRYRITGRRGDEAYLSFTLHRGTRGSGFEQFFDSHINHHDLKTDGDGHFEIIVSPEPEGENWLRASPDANEIYARAYHFDPIHDRRATYHIEPIDPPLPALLNRDAVAQRLREMARLVGDMTRSFPQPLDNPNTVGELWQTDPNGPSRMWSALDNVYARGVFALLPSEALVVEGVVVPCDYWGIQLWNPFLGSGDYRRHKVTINTEQAHLGPNGEFRVVIASEDPKVPNLDWISTSGERQGTFFIRWMCPSARPPEPTCHVVDLRDVRAR
jgi:hypothetical protein